MHQCGEHKIHKTLRRAMRSLFDILQFTTERLADRIKKITKMTVRMSHKQWIRSVMLVCSGEITFRVPEKPENCTGKMPIRSGVMTIMWEVQTWSASKRKRLYQRQPKTANQWSHLQPIAQKLPPLLNGDFGLLIGYNCSQALTPREVIASPTNPREPYAQRTDLGRSIVGTSSKQNVKDGQT